ncbi:hypothetical protein HFN20_08520 [Paenibacillus dendritiformis]|nr:hypothetical protein [Paenibacillus dendritiformis]NRF97841.1 hypothetical protein [Paenibacillus dendritiformis]
MQILHKLENKDLKENSVVMRAFEKTSLSDYGTEAVCTFSVSEVGSGMGIIRVKGCVDLHSSKKNPNLISKATVYFPERKYGIEFIKETSNYTIEFIYEQRDPKEYFNLVLTDRRGYILSSATYVFNANSIVPYPILERDLSPHSSYSELTESDDRLVFKSFIRGTTYDGPLTIYHTWQNVGQHILLQA